MKKTLFDKQNYLDAFIKTAQYLANLTSQQDIWAEIVKVMIHFFAVDLIGFGECRAGGEIVGHHWVLPDGVSSKNILTAETTKIINEVLESGFLATHQIYTPEQYALAFLSLKQGKQTTAVMLVGHRISGVLPKEILNIYLAVAGLVGTTITKLSAEKELRKLKDNLEIEVDKKTSELKERIADLERYQEATTDRELRMKELRDKIEELESKLKEKGE